MDNFIVDKLKVFLFYFIVHKLNVFVLKKQLIIAPSYLTKAQFNTQFCLHEIGSSDVLKNTIDERFAFFS